jgi:hypothetical protein
MKHKKIKFDSLNDYRLKRLYFKIIKKETNLRKALRWLQHILSTEQKLDIKNKLDNYLSTRASIGAEINHRNLKKNRNENV